MSELICKGGDRFGTRVQFLSTVSAMTLLGSAIVIGNAAAESNESNGSKVWIEVGWQFEDQGPKPEQFAPFFSNEMRAIGFTPPSDVEGLLPWSYGPEGKVSFQPANSIWTISASLRYGRSNGHRLLHQNTQARYVTFFAGPFPVVKGTVQPFNFGQTNTRSEQDHLVTDFQAGRDVGIGLFGSMSHSLLSAGLRMVEFHSKTYSKIDTVPNFFLHTHIYPKYKVLHQNFDSVDQESATFEGIGPSLSWDASAQLTGDESGGGLTFDWGANAAVLFGRQKATGNHETKVNYYSSFELAYSSPLSIQTRSTPHDRRRSVVVPNIGGFAGVSLRFPHGKVSLGYRGDIFFGAMDEGIDTRKTYNMYFHGPYATISIGLGG